MLEVKTDSFRENKEQTLEQSRKTNKESETTMWPSLLQHYIQENRHNGKRLDPELHLKELMYNSCTSEVNKDPTLKHIPSLASRISSLKSCSSVKLGIRKLARNEFLKKKSLEILSEKDISNLYRLLSGIINGQNGMINYTQLVDIGKRFPSSTSFYFSAITFNKFLKNSKGQIKAQQFFEYVYRHVSLLKTRLQLSIYDTEGYGFLREQDIETYIYDLVPSLKPLTGLQDDFYPFYVFTAVRKFFFILDPRHSGKIQIKDMLVSSVLEELLALTEPTFSEENDSENWFSANNTRKIYDQYLKLDIDHNGMLSKNELSRYRNGSLTNTFIERVFEECRTYDGEMDYKTFLDFVLALENKKSDQALTYFWKLLDFKKCGYIDAFTINYFFREIAERLRDLNGEVVAVEDVKDEIFDMVNPENPTRITLADLKRCKQGDVFITMLIDLHGFWEYENRETHVVQGTKEEEERSISEAGKLSSAEDCENHNRKTKE